MTNSKKQESCKTTAICNQKGGVTKTTTTANLGIGLAMQGKRVLLVDIDPQADLTTALGWPDSDALPMTLADIMEKTVNDEELEAAKGEIDRSFPQEQECGEKSARLKELNILLNMDQKDREILDAEPDEGDIGPPQRSPGLAR